MSTVRMLVGDCRVRLRELADASVDAVITDPPYELAFMGRGWDASGVAYDRETWAECLRVLKPGGHLLAFGGTRTYHRMACAVEDAGFEIRDSITWLYGSGFPKSLDVSKAIDKAAGAQREVVGSKLGRPGMAKDGGNQRSGFDAAFGGAATGAMSTDITAPATPDAATWAGWGTALKPAGEPIVVGRKPLIGTVVANVLAYGTGGLNIDACRIASAEAIPNHHGTNGAAGTTYGDRREYEPGSTTAAGPDNVQVKGRWPANVVLTHAEGCVEVGSREVKRTLIGEKTGGPSVGVYGDGLHGSRCIGVTMETVPVSLCAPGCPIAELDAQSGTLTSGKMLPTRPAAERSTCFGQDAADGYTTMETYGDTGGASRFFYCAKAPRSERPVGPDGTKHPTVKPLSLMRWLVRLVTPPGGTVLDPFAGSGTTIEAALLEGFDVIGCELTEDYLPLIVVRVKRARGM